MPLARSRLLRTCRYALSFDGVNDYVEVPHSNSLQLTSEMTLMAWIYPKSWVKPGTADESVIIAKYYQYWMMFNNPGGLRFRIHDGTHLYEACTPTNLMSLNNWYFIAATFDRPTVYIYINNVRYGPYTLNYSAWQRTNPVRVGAWTPTLNQIYGLIGEARIYSRALSQDEILWNYNNPDNPVWNGLVLWLPGLDEYIQPPTWKDRSPFGNNGTIYDATKTEIILKSVRSQSPIRIQSPVR